MGPTREEPFLPVGFILRPHGVRGKVKVKTYSGSISGLLSISTVFLQKEVEKCGSPTKGVSRSLVPYSVMSIQEARGVLILSLEGVPTLETAKDLAGRELFVKKSDLPPPSSDEFYYYELEGMRAIDMKGREWGKIVRVIPSAAHDILEIMTPSGVKLIPFVETFVPEVRREEGVVVIDPPPE